MNFLRSTNNLQKMYVIKAMRGGLFSIAIIVLLFQEHGLTMQEITMLQSLFAVAVIIFELPTGYFADHHGRKKSIVIGGCFSTLGYIAYSLSGTFFEFLGAEILLAVGCGFVSGADSAIIYDNTDGSEGNCSFIKTEGNGASASMFSEALTSFIGGSFLALVSLRLPLYFDALLALSVIPVALTLHEPQKPKKQKRESSLISMLRLMKYSLHDHVEIKWLILYSGLVSASTLTMVWFNPIYWEAAHIPLRMFGVLWAAFLCVGAGISLRAHWAEDRLGRKRLLLMLVTLPVMAYLFLSAHVASWSLVFITLFYVTRGLNNPIMKSYLNGLVSSEKRATILSAQSLMGRLLFAIIGPIMGWINDTYSLQTAMFACSVLFAVLGVIALIFLHKNRLL